MRSSRIAVDVNTPQTCMTGGRGPRSRIGRICGVACLGALVYAFGLSINLAAQTASAINKLAVDENAPDVATAQGYTYKYYDGASAGVPLVGTTCTGTTSPFVCAFTFPAFTPGSHSITITASNQAGESAKSAVITFTFAVIPAVPLNPRVQ